MSSSDMSSHVHGKVAEALHFRVLLGDGLGHRVSDLVVGADLDGAENTPHEALADELLPCLPVPSELRHAFIAHILPHAVVVNEEWLRPIHLCPHELEDRAQKLKILSSGYARNDLRLRRRCCLDFDLAGRPLEHGNVHVGLERSFCVFVNL